MKQINMRFAIVAAGLLGGTGGCGTSSSNGSTGPSGTTQQYEEVLGYDWTLDAGVEDYYCVYKTLTEDLWVSDFRPLSPKGTHHVTLGFQDPVRLDGIASADDTTANPPCNGLTLGQNLAFGATVGTDEFTMPEGVAVKIPAGKQLLLSVHVINTGVSKLSGHTGIEAVRADPSKVQNEAEIIFANDVHLNIPPGPSTQTGTCTMDADSTIFAVLPHMHLMGTHLTSIVGPPGGPTTTLIDQDYQFDAQKFLVKNPPIEVKKGDQIQTTCTYDNTGSNTLTFGESTLNNEMCITITYRYPAQATSFNCAM